MNSESLYLFHFILCTSDKLADIGEKASKLLIYGERAAEREKGKKNVIECVSWLRLSDRHCRWAGGEWMAVFLHFPGWMALRFLRIRGLWTGLGSCLVLLRLREAGGASWTLGCWSEDAPASPGICEGERGKKVVLSERVSTEPGKFRIKSARSEWYRVMTMAGQKYEACVITA